MREILILLICLLVASLAEARQKADSAYCKDGVLPLANFDYKKYYGVWYEIGKIQTPEGAKFQIGCHCTAATHTVPSDPKSPSDVDEVFSCRKWRPQGRFSNISASLTKMDPPGNYTETYFPGEPFENSSKYTIMDQGFDEAGNEYRLVYVCSANDYCVHFFGRNPVLGDATVKRLIGKAESMGLNPFNVDYEAIDHNGCW